MAGACSDDALVRGRRGELSADEARALEAHLATCALCRMSVGLGRAVGPLSGPDDEEQAMARRLVDRQLGAAVEARLPRVVALPVRATRWRGRTLALAASLLLLASAASAAYWTVHVKAARRAAAERAAWTPPPAAPARRTTTGTTTGEPAPERLPPPAPVIEEKPSAAAPPVRAPVRATRTAALDPEALLRDANEARRARRLDEAARGYRALQARFPSSREAVLSHLSLGNLLLSQGAFADALAQFQSYLRSDGAELAEEALLGQARALAALGRADDERTVWRTLESRFPKSEYSWRARQRLRALDRGAAP